MDPRDFWKVGEFLVVAPRAGAAHFRTAIGRAYYSSFNFASLVLGELGFKVIENHKGHAHAVRILQRSGDVLLEAAGGLLGDLHAGRIKADYNLSVTAIEKMTAAQVAIETSKTLIDDLDSFRADPSRKAKVISVVTPIYNQLVR